MPRSEVVSSTSVPLVELTPPSPLGCPVLSATAVVGISSLGTAAMASSLVPSISAAQRYQRLLKMTCDCYSRRSTPCALTNGSARIDQLRNLAVSHLSIRYTACVSHSVRDSVAVQPELCLPAFAGECCFEWGMTTVVWTSTRRQTIRP